MRECTCRGGCNRGALDFPYGNRLARRPRPWSRRHGAGATQRTALLRNALAERALRRAARADLEVLDATFGVGVADVVTAGRQSRQSADRAPFRARLAARLVVTRLAVEREGDVLAFDGDRALLDARGARPAFLFGLEGKRD